MARVNVGINPIYLSDQHLIAESVEITMITGGLIKNNCQIKGRIPNSFTLGKGHINFFKNKLTYLKTRLMEVNKEMSRRGFSNSTNIDLNKFPHDLWVDTNNYKPIMQDSIVVRERIANRLLYPLKAKSNFHRYQKKNIESIEKFTKDILHSPLFYV
jgi:deoxyribonuclease (pyrimidine dimer)